MCQIPDFPDRHHLEYIRDRLWCGREYGQAAVMVGAGFSCNADPISSGSPEMPRWGQLIGQMYDRLNPANKDSTRRAQAISNALGVAQEFEVAFTRQVLEDFLRQTIPDSQYQPGQLHQLLMSLPWSDVFTTNYDTLLERTQPLVFEHRYDTIYSSQDIPGKMKPRITKLHGSFPSYRPFTITQEDYRVYPVRCAPFVNMVQQSIMENTFCLIGFSGEDPNFLNWIGWVRDNLADAMHPIYLCGILDRLTQTKRQVLSSQNIITVDISPVFPRTEWSQSSTRHQKGLEWLLLSLHNGRPVSNLNWPLVDPPTPTPRPSPGLPPLIPGTYVPPPDCPDFPSSSF